MESLDIPSCETIHGLVSKWSKTTLKLWNKYGTTTSKKKFINFTIRGPKRKFIVMLLVNHLDTWNEKLWNHPIFHHARPSMASYQNEARRFSNIRINTEQRYQKFINFAICRPKRKFIVTLLVNHLDTRSEKLWNHPILDFHVRKNSVDTVCASRLAPCSSAVSSVQKAWGFGGFRGSRR